MDEEREEGEMSDDSMSVDETPASPPDRKPITIHPQEPFDIIYRPEKDGLFIEKLEKTDSIKVEERARRFGINLIGNKVISQKQIDELYENIGINDGNERHIRFDTLHLRGVSGLTTRDVFDYLKEYKPVSLERINKSSCNVVCQDHISAALAILAHSKEMAAEDIKSVADDSPPYYWREGVGHPKSDLILLRFATRSDKLKSLDSVSEKIVDAKYGESLGKNPWGDLCKSWGIYDHQEVYGPKLPPKSYIKTDAGIVRKHPANDSEDDVVILPRALNIKLAKRLGKRHYEDKASDEERDSDGEWKTKTKVPRMRMHADDEEQKLKTKQLISDNSYEEEESYPSLSIQIDNTANENTIHNSGKSTLSETFSHRLKGRLGHPKVDIQSRLGERVPDNTESESSDESSSSSYSEVNVMMSKVQKAPSSNEKRILSVWSRLEKSEPQGDLRQTLKKSSSSTKQPSLNDLRSKLKEKSKRNKSPLRIEVDNEYYESD